MARLVCGTPASCLATAGFQSIVEHGAMVDSGSMLRLPRVAIAVCIASFTHFAASALSAAQGLAGKCHDTMCVVSPDVLLH